MPVTMCQSCGYVIIDPSQPCPSCGKTQVPPAPAEPPRAAVPPPAEPPHMAAPSSPQPWQRTQSAGAMGNLLVSGSGEGNPDIVFWRYMNLAGAILFGIFVCFVLPGFLRSLARDSFSLRRTEFLEGFANIFFYFGLLGTIGGVVGTVMEGKTIAKTEIKVYENGIEGYGAGYIRNYGFQLAYNQIASVDVTKTYIVVNAANTKYRCYVTNGQEIQNTIFNQRNKGS